MAVREYIGSQLRQPRGWFGRVVMSRALNHGNTELINATLDTLELEDRDAYLDVGFGGGLSFEIASNRIRSGRMLGIDYSPEMVAECQRRFRHLVAHGRLDVVTAEVTDIPLRDGIANKVSAVNTIYFWPELEVALGSLHRVLAVGGTLAIGFSGAAKMNQYPQVTASNNFTPREPADVIPHVEALGFVDVECIALDGKRTVGDYVVRATRSR